MSFKQIIYLVLSIVGLCSTWYFNFQYMAETQSTFLSFDIVDFIRDCFSNPAASSISSDVLVGATAASLFIFYEGRRLSIKRWWVYILLNSFVAFAFAFPLFLFVRERALQE